MANPLVFNIAALLALVPATLLPFRREIGARDLMFWSVLAAAVAGPAAYSWIQLAGPWQTGLGMALWLSIAASMMVFAGLAVITAQAWRLAPLLMPYLLGLAVLATIWRHVPAQDLLVSQPGTWLKLHILFALATYALITVAAVAGTAVFLQERALKRKETTALTRRLPSIADGESLEFRLLAAAEVVLGVGIVTGSAVQYLVSDHILTFDHKTLLSILAFGVIGSLLFLHHRSGLRGRRATRLALLAYLLLTLAYPGVKVVTDLLMA